MTQPASNAAVVLVIEDEAPIRRFLKVSLTEHGFVFKESLTGNDGINKAAMESPDLIILDLGLPDMDGLEVTRRIREWSTVPIIVLSARGSDKDKVNVLDAGADDYLTKPFSVPELLARVRVALRHAAMIAPEPDGAIFSVGNIRVDLVKRQVLVGDVEVHLTPIEYRLLVAMIQHAGKVVTHNQLLRQIWGEGYGEESHYVRVFMAQLRRKVEEDPARPKYLITEPGVGYRLKVE
ncbi:response regulator [Candidatus Obscuribacterales bacterium]|nr:response regulator [Candidatus Obscuribacterales bacterium]